jgi:hypothetical protein
VIHNWSGGHAHDAVWATTDSPERVRAYFRRFAAQNQGYHLTDTPERFLLDGSGAMGIITVSPARPDARLQAGEQTLISSSRP